jgi:hypothetical protein
MISYLNDCQVFVLFLADTANSLLDAMALYGTLVKHFGMFHLYFSLEPD